VLKAAFWRARHGRHDALGPVGQHRLEARLALAPPHLAQRQHRRRRVDVHLRQAGGDAPVIPVFDRRQQRRIASLRPQFHQAIETDALRPFPAVEADIVARRAVEVGLNKTAVGAQARHTFDEAGKRNFNLCDGKRHRSSCGSSKPLLS
jgi:hypothetical protein